jgi:hypothetical protein
MMSQLVEAEVDGHRLSDDEIYLFLLLLPVGAADAPGERAVLRLGIRRTAN